MTAFAMLFVAGAPMRKLGGSPVPSAGLVLLLLVSFPYQRARVVTFLNPWADPTGDGFQIVQSQIAIGSGGMFGQGPRQQHPEELLSARGADRHDRRDHRRGARPDRPFVLIAAFVVLAIAGFRIAMRRRTSTADCWHGDHIADLHPGRHQHRTGVRRDAGHRCPAALRLRGRHQSRGIPCQRWDPGQHLAKGRNHDAAKAPDRIQHG